MNDLENKVIVITGASGGMGREISKRLFGCKAKLVLLSNDVKGLEELAAELKHEEGGEYLTIVSDVRDEESVKLAFDETVRCFGSPEILLNLAGLSIPAKLWDMSETDFDLMLDVNVKGTFLAMKHFARTNNSDGHIVNIGSMAAKRANGNAPVYCTAKAAVNMLSAGAAIQLKEKNIRVTTLNPGGADTPFWGERKVDRSRLLRTSDIADVIMFILTLDSRVAVSEINFESFLAL